ncbi:MAG: copper resistance CopC family protein [Streptosporangiaceae bacterium]
MILPTLRLGLLALVLAVLLPPSPASAHTELTGSDPADRAKIRSPASVSLEFSDPLQASLVRVQVRNTGDTAVQQGKPKINGGRIEQRLKSNLPAGPYVILYRVVSTDGHPVEGSLRFTVIGPTETSVPLPEPTVAAEPVEGGSGRWAVVIGGVFVVLGVVGGILYLRRRNA